MYAKKTISSIFVIFFVIVFMLSAAQFQTVHAARLRYVTPGGSGTGDCSSWANACDLQVALTGAVGGDEIWVAAGTYRPTGGADRSTTFQLKNGVALYGGFAGTETLRDQRDPSANVTILSGDLNGDDNGNTWFNEETRSDNSYHVVTGASGAMLDGFTIMAGNASGAAPNDRGGGMYNINNNPTLVNVTFDRNSAIWDGGGMYNESGSSPVLTKVTFTGNTASNSGGGMSNLNGSNPKLTNVTFSGNDMYNDSSSPTLTGVTFSGSGMSNQSSNPTLTDVIFSNSPGTGMTNNHSSPTLTNVTFSRNSRGGMSNNSSNPTLTNVTFSGNSTGSFFIGGSGSGGGMRNSSSSPTLTNVTFDNNSAYCGGGMYNNNSSPKLTNVTFSSNWTGSGGPYSCSNDYYATGGDGAGMYNDSSSPTLTNVTFSRNMAEAYGGSMYNANSSRPQIRNTIFWGDTGNFGIYNDASSSPAVSDSVVQDGYAGGANIITADPRLGTIGEYGGFTQTLPLLAGSSAIDAGNDAACPATDQRGMARPQGAKCDIGAFEYVDPAVASSVRADANPTNAASVNFTVTFSEAVTGVDVTDFTLYTYSISGANVTGVSGSGSVYTVTVSTGTSSGYSLIRLDVADDDSIIDGAGKPLGGAGAGNGNYSDGQTYNIDNTAPAVTAFTISTPSNSKVIPISAFSATDDMAVTGYLITESAIVPEAGDTGWTDTAPATYTVASDGTYILYPWARDATGNVSAEFAFPRTVVVATTAPDTQIDTHPANPSNSTDASFTFSSPDGTATFKCSLDGGIYSTCTSPKNYTGLAAGSHTFSVQARDPAGNVDASPAAYTWRIIINTTCYSLTLAHTGNGNDPTASPESSNGCSTGQYYAGELITLTASPDSGWSVGSWSGTDNDSSSSNTNSVTIQGATTVTANYIKSFQIYLPLVGK